MRQLFLPDHTPTNVINLEAGNYHHIVNVLRLQKGDTVSVIFKTGEAFEAVLTDILARSCTIQLGKKIPQPKSNPKISLIQAITKGKKMDQIIRQATECGVSSIIPIETEFTQVKLQQKEIQNKIDRWNRIIKEALQQCGSKIITSIQPPVSLDKLQVLEDNCVGLFFHQDVLELNSLHGYLSSCPRSITICIGPEGGFSPSETDFLSSIGFHSIYLGEQVLRSETAAVYAIGAVKTLLQEKHTWVLRN